MRPRFVALIVLFPMLSFGGSRDDELSSVVSGLRDSRAVVREFQLPLSYLKTLKPKDPKAKLSPRQRYQLARTFLDVHHLCAALAHQSYFLDPVESFPILKLAEENFPGFRELGGGDGYNTARIAEFFEKNGSLWSAAP
jgi:hypothetical protein